MAMGMSPVFPVRYLLRVRRGWPWDRRWETTEEVFENVEDLASALEIEDTRIRGGAWIEDATGRHWDVKLDLLREGMGSVQFFERPAT